MARIGEEVLLTNGPENPVWIGLFDILGFENLNEVMPESDLGVALERIPTMLDSQLGFGAGRSPAAALPDGSIAPALLGIGCYRLT